jgi:rhodanese-related sulfurtransferase
MTDITAFELNERLAEGTAPIMIDVREPHEWEMQHLDAVRKISLGSLGVYLSELKEELADKEVVMICRSGGRSGQATAFLRSQGFTNVRNLVGGMLGWKKDIDPEFEVI